MNNIANFERSNTFPNRTVPNSKFFINKNNVPKYFYNKTRLRGGESNYRTIIKNLELFLKTRVFLKKKPIKYLKKRINL